MHTIDLVNLAFSSLKKLDVQLRFIPAGSVTCGLCRIRDQQILFLDESSTAAEQLQLISAAFQTLQIDFRLLSQPLRTAVLTNLAVPEAIQI